MPYNASGAELTEVESMNASTKGNSILRCMMTQVKKHKLYILYVHIVCNRLCQRHISKNQLIT